MSTKLAIPEDYKFFDFLTPFRWPYKSLEHIELYRELVQHGDLQIETILENALAQASNKTYTRIAENHADFSDGSDAKKAISCFRNNNKAKNHWMNTFAITNLKNKTGLIRALCYSRYQEKFYCFAIPYPAYKGKSNLEIMLDNSTGYQEPLGIPKGKWSQFLVKDFKTLANITHEQAIDLFNDTPFE